VYSSTVSQLVSQNTYCLYPILQKKHRKTQMNPNYLWRLTNKMIQQVGVYLEESLQTNKSVYLCKSFPQS
jgi:hypothetical protein